MIITRTPFRLPLGGGGTDLPRYYEKYKGFLITATIDKYMYININQPALVNKIKVNYTKTEIVDEPDELKHELVRECLKLIGIGAPIEIHSMADLSGGTGLGSSSTYTVGLLNGLNVIKKKRLSTKELAELACKVEIELIGKPVGKQDQYAAAFGGIIVMEVEENGNVTVIPLNLHSEVIREMENSLMMFYTHIARDANKILSEQSKKAQIDDSTVIKCMHQIKEIGKKSYDAIMNGDFTYLGKLLHEHWNVKKHISDKMSNSKINQWYDIAMNNGALGGKIMGAGGGGFFLFCVENGKRKKIMAALENAGLRYMDFRFDFEGSKVISNF